MAPGKNRTTRMIRLSPMVIGITLASPYARALTIESKDLGYIPGHTYNFVAGSFSPTGLDLTPGTGKQWNLASFTGSGFYNYTRIYNVSNDSKFPSATLAMDIEGRTSVSFSSILYYREQNGDWLNLGEVSGGSTLTYSPSLPMGLPHSVGKTWSSNFTYSGASATQNGTVVAEGTVITKLGSFQALLVKLQTGSATMYNFETKEYGRIAFAMTSNSYLYVMTSGTENLGVKFHPPGRASEQDIFTYAGSPGTISVESRLPGQLRIYSGEGRLFGLADIQAATPWRRPAESGIYAIRFISSHYDLSQRITVKK